MMPEDKISTVRNIIDGVTGVSAVTWPIWLQWAQMGVGLFMLFGGAGLLVIRLMIAWRQWRRDHPK